MQHHCNINANSTQKSHNSKQHKINAKSMQHQHKVNTKNTKFTQTRQNHNAKSMQTQHSINTQNTTFVQKNNKNR